MMLFLTKSLRFFLMWTITIFTGLVTILLPFYVWFFALSMWELSSPTRDWTCIGRWSLNHWTARDVPSLDFFVQHWVKRAPCHPERCILTGGNLKPNEEGFFCYPNAFGFWRGGVTPPDIVNKETGLRLVSLTQLLSCPRFHWPQRQTWWPVFSLSHTPKAALGDLSFP